MKKNIILTGATGYIGYKLVKVLLDSDHNVYAIIRNSSNKKDIISPYLNHTNFYLIEYSGDIQELISAFSNINNPTVVHLASNFMFQHKSEDIDSLIESNVTFGSKILEAMSVNNIESFIYTGTSWQNFHSEKYNPVCFYAATKEAFEKIVEYYVSIDAIRSINLKLFDTYGPDDFRPKLFTLLKKVASTGESFDMSPGDQLVNLVHVDDICSALRLTIEMIDGTKLGTHEKYGVSAKDQMPLKDMVKLFSTIIGKPININWGRRPYRNREVMIPCKTYNDLPNWSQNISLNEGLKQLI